MSSGKWIRAPNTGHPPSLVGRVDDRFLRADGWFDPERLFQGQRFDLTDVRSIAYVVGMGSRYLVNSVLTVPDCPIHLERKRMVDQDTGAHLFTVHATMVCSAQAGGEMWRERRKFERKHEITILEFEKEAASSIRARL